MTRKKRKSKARPLIVKHLSEISRALLEGDKRSVFLSFLQSIDDRRGIYALYNKKGGLYYAGKAIDLPKRLDNHLDDQHANDWLTMSLFFLDKSANISQMEGLLIAGGKPDGNERQPSIGQDIRNSLKKFLKEDAIRQIDSMIFVNENESAEESDVLRSRITPKKLKMFTQTDIARVIGITQGRVNQLINQDKKGYKSLLKYIREGGHRDKILKLLGQ